MSYHFIQYKYFVNLLSKNDSAGLCQEKNVYISKLLGDFLCRSRGRTKYNQLFYWPIMVLDKEEKASIKTALLEARHW